MAYVIIICIVLCIVMSLRALFFPSKWKDHQLSINNFLYLGICYVTIMLGFGLVFLLLEIEGIPILLESGEEIGEGFLNHLFTTMYFSGITLFSVGYGDITPVGIGRVVALVESWLGYTIPAAFVVKSIIQSEHSKNA